VFALATLPIEIHTYPCRGFTEAKPVLDTLAPGSELAAFDPDAPSGRARAEVRWGMRAKAYWYLDRTLVNYATPAELAAAAPPFVVTRDRDAAPLAEAGYQPFLDLDARYRLLRRAAPPAGSGPMSVAPRGAMGGSIGGAP
jgi:hypothetical protein